MNGKIPAEALGVVSGVLIDKIYNSTGWEESAVDYIHHYHWGLGLLALSSFTPISGFLNGLGYTFIIEEMFHPEPFGVGDPPEVLGRGLTVTWLLLSAVFLAEAYKKK